MERSARCQIFFSFFFKGYNKVFSIVTTIGEQLFMLESKYDQYQRVSGFHWNWKGDLGPGCLFFPLGHNLQKYQSSTGLFLKVSWISLNLPEKTFWLAWILLLNSRKITAAQSALAIIPAELFSYICFTFNCTLQFYQDCQLCARGHYKHELQYFSTFSPQYSLRAGRAGSHSRMRFYHHFVFHNTFHTDHMFATGKRTFHKRFCKVTSSSVSPGNKLNISLTKPREDKFRKC